MMRPLAGFTLALSLAMAGCGCDVAPAVPPGDSDLPMALPDVAVVLDGALEFGANCGNRRVDPPETDLDCGGPCPPCRPGLDCRDGRDCTSQVCSGGICSSPSCKDGIKNGDEVDVDCAGRCDPCGEGGLCGSGADCAKGECARGRCASTGSPEARRYVVGAGVDSLAVAEVTGDGLPDILVGVTVPFLFGLRVLRRSPDGSYQLDRGIDYGPRDGANEPMRSADFNGDKSVDVATSSWLSQNAWVILGQGGGMFGKPASYELTKVHPGLRRLMAVGDFDGDGDVDIAADGFREGLTLLLNRGDGVFSTKLLAESCGELVAVDLDRDGLTDLLCDSPGDGLIAYTKRLAQRRVWALWTGLVAVGDFNGDGWPDAAFDLALALNDGKGGLLPPRTLTNEPGRVLMGDFNGDGRPDLASVRGRSPSRLRGQIAYTVSIALGAANGKMEYLRDVVVWTSGPFFSAWGVGDVFGDKREELLFGLDYNNGGVGNEVLAVSFR